MPRWLDVCRHRVRGCRAPFFVVPQHHCIAADTRIVAPVAPLGDGTTARPAPRLTVDGMDLRAVLLAMTPVRVALLGPAVAADFDEDDILRGLDAIFRGYPVGLPIA